MNLNFSNASVLNDWQMNLGIALCGAFPWAASLLPALYLQKNEVMTWWIQSSQFALRCFQILLGKPQRKSQTSSASPSQTRLPKSEQTKESKAGGEWAITEAIAALAYAHPPASRHQYLPVWWFHIIHFVFRGAPVPLEHLSTLHKSSHLILIIRLWNQWGFFVCLFCGGVLFCFVWKGRFREIKSHSRWGCRRWDLNPDGLTPDQSLLFCQNRIR